MLQSQTYSTDVLTNMYVIIYIKWSENTYVHTIFKLVFYWYFGNVKVCKLIIIPDYFFSFEKCQFFTIKKTGLAF
jgi:hypothetical protein